MDYWRLVSPDSLNANILTGTHNHALCLLGVLIAIMAAYVMLPVASRYHSKSLTSRNNWLLAGSAAMGIGIWGMHFTSMLAYRLPLPISYDPLITLLSIIPAIIASAACIVLYRAKINLVLRLQMSALALAAGIGMMHYLGMEAIETQAEMFYSPSGFFASLLAAYVLAVIGLLSQSRLAMQQHLPIRLATLIGSLILGTAVSTMHFIAMHATYFVVPEGLLLEHDNAAPLGLVLAIFAISLILPAMIQVGALVERRMLQMAESLEQSEERFQQLTENTQALIFTVVGNEISYVNPAMSSLLGSTADEIQGKKLLEVFGRDFEQVSEELLSSSVDLGQTRHQQLSIDTPDGKVHWLYFSLTLSELDGQRAILASAMDISEQKQAELNMRELAFTDQLTGLANRSRFSDRLHNLLQRQIRDPHLHGACVVLLDLDKFKNINDRYGHQCGDFLLIEIARRLQVLARASDTVARLAGDEFILLFEGLDQHQKLVRIAERIFESLVEPMELNGVVISVEASLGILLLEGANYKDIDSVLHDVDVALYRAKNDLSSYWSLYDEELDSVVKRARRLQGDLRMALEEDELELFYQPIVDAGNLQICGFEALARWQHQNGEWISPAEFIPLAEQMGLITELTRWSMRTACRQLQQWSSAFPDKPLYISVNVASICFDNEHFMQLLEALARQIDSTQGQLKLELTESILMKDIEATLDKLNHLLQLGYELMIDDFGTGYSSLSYLHLLPAKVVKIDRSFIAELREQGETAPIINTIFALVKTLDLRVVSEGIENDYQRRELARLGSHQLQGYLFSRPVPAAAASKLIENGLLLQDAS